MPVSNNSKAPKAIADGDFTDIEFDYRLKNRDAKTASLFKYLF
jgi:hypothetical protein